MGRLKNGILDGFEGTVGTVVGGNWRGVEYMRSKSKKRRTTLTEAQLQQQAKFKLVSKFTQRLNDLLTLGFREYAVKMTGVNYALSSILQTAITGTYPDFKIDYSKVLLTKGNLPAAKKPAAVAEANGILRFNWTNNAGKLQSKVNDQAILVAYCPELNDAEYVFGPAREAGTGTLDVSEFSGKLVQTWISFMSASGRLMAESTYTGEVTIA